MDAIEQKNLTRILLKALECVEKGNDIPSEFANILFPPSRKENELVYFGKDTESSIIANTLYVPFQLEKKILIILMKTKRGKIN